MHITKGRLKIFLVILTILVFLTAIYFTFFFYYKCSDLGCYQSHQEQCAKTKFINEQGDAVWFYKIEGKENKLCRVNVKVLTVKEGSSDKAVLEGKSMDCFLPLKSTLNPESDLSLCHGILKEEMQDIIIQKMHAYVLEHVGEISQELEKAV